MLHVGLCWKSTLTVVQSGMWSAWRRSYLDFCHDRDEAVSDSC